MHEKHRFPSGNAGELDYYDLALAVVPIPLLLGLLAGKFLALPTQTGVSVGAALSALAVGHLLFRDPPTRRKPRGRGGGSDRSGRFDGPSA